MSHLLLLHYRDELREARLKALRDAEAFQEIVFVLERIGVHLLGDKVEASKAKVENLGQYEKYITQCALKSPLAKDIPEACEEWHTPFKGLYKLVLEGRNDALHQGAFARHLTAWAIELATILEDALVNEATRNETARVKDFMIRNPSRAYLWQPMSSIRQIMLANSFSYLPVAVGEQWYLISDHAVATFLRPEGETEDERKKGRKKRLACKLQDALPDKSIVLCQAQTCCAGASVNEVLKASQSMPVLVLGGNPGELQGLVTPF